MLLLAGLPSGVPMDLLLVYYVPPTLLDLPLFLFSLILFLLNRCTLSALPNVVYENNHS